MFVKQQIGTRRHLAESSAQAIALAMVLCRNVWLQFTALPGETHQIDELPF